jgi:hypothetical protein
VCSSIPGLSAASVPVSYNCMLSSTATGMLAIVPSTQVSAALVAFALLSVFLAFSCRMIIGGNESAMNLRGDESLFETFRERGANLSEHFACESEELRPYQVWVPGMGGVHSLSFHTLRTYLYRLTSWLSPMLPQRPHGRCLPRIRGRWTCLTCCGTPD